MARSRFFACSLFNVHYIEAERPSFEEAQQRAHCKTVGTKQAYLKVGMGKQL